MNEVLRIEVSAPGGTIACRVHLPERVPAPVVICCHGLLSNKDSSKYTAVGALLASRGLAVVRFDFSGCGESPKRRGPLLDVRTTDLRTVVEYVLEQHWAMGKIGLLGSSLGGYLALLLAAGGMHPIEALVCWATPFRLDRVASALERSGELQQRLHGFEGLGHPRDLTGGRPVRGALVIHGRQDENVPWTDAVEIYRGLGEPKRLILLESADHRLTDPGVRKLALDASLDWFWDMGLVGSMQSGTG